MSFFFFLSSHHSDLQITKENFLERIWNIYCKDSKEIMNRPRLRIFFCKMELRNMTAIKWKSGTWPLCEKQYLVNKLLKGFWQQSFLLRLLRKIKSILQWKWKRKLRHQLLLSQRSSFAKWLSVRLQTKRLWVRMPLLSHKQFEI